MSINFENSYFSLHPINFRIPQGSLLSLLRKFIESLLSPLLYTIFTAELSSNDTATVIPTFMDVLAMINL